MVPALFITAPHASAEVPDWLRARVAAPPAALARGADPATAEVARALGAEHLILGHVNRLVCDLDQEIPDDNRPDRRFTLEDADGVPIWTTPPDWIEREEIVARLYRPWYQEVRAAREALIRRFGRLAHLDLNAWREARADEAPLLLANGGYADTGEGERVSCPPAALRALASELRAAFRLPVGINQRFKGGGVVRTFGHHPGNTLQLSWQAKLVCEGEAPDPARVRAFSTTLEAAVAAWLRGLMAR